MSLIASLPGGEKLSVGLSMSTRWSDPPIMLILVIPGLIAILGTTAYGLYCTYGELKQGDFDFASFDYEKNAAMLAMSVLPSLLTYIFWNHVYHNSGDCGVDTEKYIVFSDSARGQKLRKIYANRRIPMCEFYEFYCDGDVTFNPKCEEGDCLLILSKHRDEFVNYKTTLRQLLWLLSQFVPIQGGHGSGNSSQKDVDSTTKEIAEHYDRGNNFFHAFMGDSMVYTSGVFKQLPKFGDTLGYAASAADGTLEQAQFNKMQLICEKLQLKEGERFLDIGCGWGTLTRHAVREYGAVGTGVTLSAEGKKYCLAAGAAEGTETEILHMDYRLIPKDRKFDKIASIEMAEHVGIKNFVDPYLKSVRELMSSDDGMFLMQVAGLRQGSNWQDIAWGLFMSKYIFPGADASTPLNWYIRQLELAGFEVHSVETIGRHYSHTLHKWYDNWMSRKEAILSGDIDAERETLKGDRLFRMWEFFLAYSVIASGQGSATCYQILAHPNTYDFPRDRFCSPEHVYYGHEEGSWDYSVSLPADLRDASASARKPRRRKSSKKKTKAKRSKTPTRKKKSSKA